MTDNTTSLWEVFTREMNGEYIKRYYWHSDKAVVDYKDYKIIFDNYTHHTTAGGNAYKQGYTRVRIPYASSDNFRFDLYRQKFFSTVAKIFGAQDVVIGSPEFDKKYIIKANDAFTVKALLGSGAIQKKIEAIPTINLQISDRKGIWGRKLPTGQMELCFFTEGEISNIPHLKDIHSLMTTLIDRLEEIGSAEKQKLG